MLAGGGVFKASSFAVSCPRCSSAILAFASAEVRYESTVAANAVWRRCNTVDRSVLGGAAGVEKAKECHHMLTANHVTNSRALKISKNYATRQHSRPSTHESQIIIY